MMPHDLQASRNASPRMLFHVEGMKCLACCARVKQQVLATKGGESCEVDFEKATVAVRGAGLAEEAVLASLNTLGYRATPISTSAATKATADEAYQDGEL